MNTQHRRPQALLELVDARAGDVPVHHRADSSLLQARGLVKERGRAGWIQTSKCGFQPRCESCSSHPWPPPVRWSELSSSWWASVVIPPSATSVGRRHSDRCHRVRRIGGSADQTPTYLFRLMYRHEEVHRPRLRAVTALWRSATELAWQCFALGVHCNRETMEPLQTGFDVEAVDSVTWRGMPGIVPPLVAGIAHPP